MGQHFTKLTGYFGTRLVLENIVNQSIAKNSRFDGSRVSGKSVRKTFSVRAPARLRRPVLRFAFSLFD